MLITKTRVHFSLGIGLLPPFHSEVFWVIVSYSLQIGVTGLQATSFSKMFVTVYNTTRCHIPEDYRKIFHLGGNFRSITSLFSVLPKFCLLHKKPDFILDNLTRRRKESTFISNVTNFLICYKKIKPF